jgi:hypothetical protein
VPIWLRSLDHPRGETAGTVPTQPMAMAIRPETRAYKGGLPASAAGPLS